MRGDIGIVYVPETQLFIHAQQGSTACYAQCMQGAYRGFFDGNIQADWVHIDDVCGFMRSLLERPALSTYDVFNCAGGQAAASVIAVFRQRSALYSSVSRPAATIVSNFASPSACPAVCSPVAGSRAMSP